MNGPVKSALTFGLSLCVCGTAYAHAHLLQSVPPAGAAVVHVPDALKLDFSEGVQLSFTGVTLHGPGGEIVATGDNRLAPNDNKELVVPLARPLSGGKYIVEWHALSDDGHSTHGSYIFRVSN